MRSQRKGKRKLTMILLSSGVSLLLFSASNLNTACNKNESCSSKPQTLNEIIEKSIINKNTSENQVSDSFVKQEKIISEEENNINKIDDKKENKNKFENPGIFIAVILAFSVMYYYFKDNKKKRKK